MAITNNCSKFLFYAKSLNVSFQNTVTLGRMTLYATKEEITKQLAQFHSDKKITDVTFTDGYSEPLFTLLGADHTDSLDYSDYEKATIVHDMNTPIPGHLKNKYTAVVDGGTIEHVFNFPVAIKNCMEMVKVGGHYIGITPANNTMGHGFYQFSPELYFNILNADNGFEVKQMIIATQQPSGVFSDWYEVKNPAKVKSRVMLVNTMPTYIMVIAEKVKDVPVFATIPQQSDYQVAWAARKAQQDNKPPAKGGKLKYLYGKVMPKPIRVFLRNFYDMFTKEKVVDENLGNINAEHFRKIQVP